MTEDHDTDRTLRYIAHDVTQILRIVRRQRRKGVVLFCYFIGENGMSTITAPNCTTSLAFGLAGNTPTGDTFAEPTVAVNPTTAGTVALQPSVQGTPTGTGTPFTTAGLFTAAAGYLGPVTLSAEVAGVDDQDASFEVVAAPETVAFNPADFVAT